MGDYHQFLSSMAGAGGSESTESPQGLSPLTQLPDTPLPVDSQPKPNPYHSLGFFTGFPEPIIFNPQKASKNRRRSAPGLDHIKHRRTRSGCYTCRSRRVKCDETHPVCERCRKGKRECLYPEPANTKNPGGGPNSKDGAAPSRTSPASSHGDDYDEADEDAKLETILDEDEPESSRPPKAPVLGPPRRASTTSLLNLQSGATSHRQGSETPSLEGTKSSSPSASTGTAGSITPALPPFPETTIVLPFVARPEWSHLPRDLQFYLSYFCDNITHYHYCMVTDADDFFVSILPVMALQSDALLYAVVGFAAYHYTLTRRDGKVKDFLQYYNRSVTLLLSSLKRKEGYTPATLMTILQLGTIEEYFGDWINLMGHQKAALEILTKLYTPQSILETSATRMMLTWYIRFDVFVALMGRFETALPKAWFYEYVAYCKARLAASPDSLDWKVEDASGRLRLISMEMSVLFGKASTGEILPEDFVAEHGRFSRELHGWKASLDPAITDRAFLVTQFGPPDEALDADDIVNPFTSDMLFKPPLFATTVLVCEWHSIVVMHESQASLPPNPEPSPGLTGHSYAICQLFEAAQLSQFSPKGSLITLHAPLAISALFLPRDQRHHMWLRRKFALLEAQGYIFPQTMRVRMAELFNDKTCVRWWLPNDEGFSPVLQSVRTFADERNATAVSTQTENLREIRHLLGAIAKMQLLGAGGGAAQGQGGDGGADDELAGRGVGGPGKGKERDTSG